MTATLEQPLPQLLLTPVEAAKALAIGARSLWRLTDEGKIPVVRVGRSVRYAVEDLRAFIDSRRDACV